MNQPALVAINRYPGKLFQAKVIGVGRGVNILSDIPNNYLPYIEKAHNWIRLPQRFPVELILVNFPKEYSLRIGASADVTIFTSTHYFWNSIAEFWLYLRSMFQYFS